MVNGITSGDINNADWASTFMPWNGTDITVTASFSALVLILNEISKWQSIIARWCGHVAGWQLKRWSVRDPGLSF